MGTENGANNKTSTPARAKSKKKGMVLLVLLVGIVLFFAVHELAVMYVADKVCVVCHEMKEPVKKCATLAWTRTIATAGGAISTRALQGTGR